MIWDVSLLPVKLIPHGLTPGLWSSGIRSLVEFSRLVGPLAHPVLYLRKKTSEADPQAISRRTSYLRVRLAFYLYPQFIQSVFNHHWFGPSRPVTVVAACPWVGHTVSGLLHATGRPIRTRFRYGSGPAALTLLRRVTRQVILQKARRHTGLAAMVLRLVVGARFQVLFHSPQRGSFHLSLTVLVRYRSSASI